MLYVSSLKTDKASVCDLVEPKLFCF